MRFLFRVFFVACMLFMLGCSEDNPRPENEKDDAWLTKAVGHADLDTIFLMKGYAGGPVFYPLVAVTVTEDGVNLLSDMLESKDQIYVEWRGQKIRVGDKMDFTGNTWPLSIREDQYGSRGLVITYVSLKRGEKMDEIFTFVWPEKDLKRTFRVVAEANFISDEEYDAMPVGTQFILGWKGVWCDGKPMPGYYTEHIRL